MQGICLPFIFQEHWIFPACWCLSSSTLRRLLRCFAWEWQRTLIQGRRVNWSCWFVWPTLWCLHAVRFSLRLATWFRQVTFKQISGWRIRYLRYWPASYWCCFLPSKISGMFCLIWYKKTRIPQTGFLVFSLFVWNFKYFIVVSDRFTAQLTRGFDSLRLGEERHDNAAVDDFSNRYRRAWQRCSRNFAQSDRFA